MVKNMFGKSEKPVEFGKAVGTQSYRGSLSPYAENNAADVAVAADSATAVDEQSEDLFERSLPQNTVASILEETLAPKSDNESIWNQITDFEMLKAVVSGNDQVKLVPKDENIDGVTVQVFGSMSVTPPEGSSEIANELVANLARLASGACRRRRCWWCRTQNNAMLQPKHCCRRLR